MSQISVYSFLTVSRPGELLWRRAQALPEIEPSLRTPWLLILNGPIPFLSLQLRRRIYLVKKLAKNNPTLPEKFECLRWLVGDYRIETHGYLIRFIFAYLADSDDKETGWIWEMSYFGPEWLREYVKERAWQYEIEKEKAKKRLIG